MIEIRWVEFEYTTEQGLRLKGKKLQYRIMQTHALGGRIYQDWMPWVDVPTVEEVKNEPA